MTIVGFGNSTNAMPDEVVDESSINGADQTRTAKNTNAQQAGDDVAGTGTEYEGETNTDLEAKTNDIISNVEEAQTLLDEMIASLGGEAEAPAGEPAEAEALAGEPAEAETAQSEAPHAETSEPGATDAGEPDLKSLTDDVRALLEQIGAIIEGEEAPAALSDDASEAPAATAPVAKDTQSAVEEASGEPAPSEEKGNAETLLERISTFMDKLMKLLKGEAKEGTDATESADVDAPDAENAEATPESDTAESNAEASSDSDVQLSLKDLPTKEGTDATEPADTEPADTESADTEPADTESADTESADVDAPDAENAEATPESDAAESNAEASSDSDVQLSLKDLPTKEGTDATESADTKSADVDAPDAEDAEATPESDAAESNAEASSDADVQLLLKDLSTSLNQVTELLGGGPEDVKAGDTGETAATDAGGNASASANTEVNITIGQGDNGEILVSTQPTDETPQKTKSDDSGPTEISTGEAPSNDAAASDSHGSGTSSTRASNDVNLNSDLSGRKDILPGFFGSVGKSTENSGGGGPLSKILGGDSPIWSPPKGAPFSGKGGGLFGMSPLTLDTDKDGSVEATAGMGVDIDGDGTADGAATGGDKMLAMSDITGDGKIGGAEVFGNKTVDPFSGKALNAENGFEALQMVAASAEEKTGMECIDDNGVVNLQKLSQALESEGIGLGMISGNNITNLESLGDVASIDTSNYVTQQDTGDVQHNQLGNYQDTSGNTHKVDDVWFSGN